MVDSMSELMPEPRAEHRVHLVEEDDDRPSFLRLLARSLEHEADLPLGLTDVLVEELWALDVEEVAARFLVTGRISDLLRERVGNSFRDECLAAARRAVEQDALGRRQAVLGEQLLVQERQLDRVSDLFDLAVQTTHVRIGDVGNLFEDQFLDFGTGQSLEEQPGAGIHQQGVAGAQSLADQGVGELGHTLLVGAPEDQRASAVVEQLLERDHFTGELPRAREHDVQRFVEHDFSTAGQLFLLELGMERHSHLSATGEHVDGAVVVACEIRAVGGRRPRQLVDLFAERGDVFARFTQGVGQLLVLRHRLRELALGLEQALFERAHSLGRVLQPSPKRDDLLLERFRRLPELGHLGLIGAESPLVLGVVDGDHLPRIEVEATIHRTPGKRLGSPGTAAVAPATVQPARSVFIGYSG